MGDSNYKNSSDDSEDGTPHSNAHSWSRLACSLLVEESSEWSDENKRKIALASWATNCNVPMSTVTQLLKCLKTNFDLPHLPADARTLLGRC